MGTRTDRPQNLYIDGRWMPSASSETVDVINPTTEEVIGTVPAGHPEDVDAAVAAARQAYPAWGRTSPQERAELVGRLADEVERQTDHFTDLVVAEVGTPRRAARLMQVTLGVIDLREAAAAASEVAWEEPLRNSVIRREPVGVVGAITPWNYPLHQITAKIGAALVAGCAVVVKASEIAPLTAIALFEAIDRVGVPAGVVNLVHGYGGTVGEALAGHPGIDMVSFTGSTAVGRRIVELSAATTRRTALELGGKSASVLLGDLGAEGFANAVGKTVRACFLNGGQSCNAQTRMVVPRSRLADAEAVAAEFVAQYPPGDPDDKATRLGPMASRPQQEKVLSYIRLGLDSGARMIAGSGSPVEAQPTGYFVQPTVFSDVDPASRIAQEEIFGPVLSIIGYDDDNDDAAVEIANATEFGIGGAVWADDRERALQVARRMRTAQVEVNGGVFNGAAPFGGFGQSGYGREGGRFGVEGFLEIKSMQL